MAGFGYADDENHIQCKSNTVMRIASISKSITMAVVAKYKNISIDSKILIILSSFLQRLWQEGKLSFDKPIQEYVPEFPEKYFDGEKVCIAHKLIYSRQHSNCCM